MHIISYAHLYQLIYSISGAFCLCMGIFVLLRNRSSLLNRLFFSFCFLIGLWMNLNCLATSRHFSYETSMFLEKIIFSSIVFLPTIALHFTIEFLGNYAQKRARLDLKIAYILTVLFCLLLWFTPYFIVGFIEYPWGQYPKGGVIHVIHSIFVVATALYVVATLWVGLNKIKLAEGRVKKYYETVLLCYAFLFATISCIDFLQSWGFAFFPLGSIFMTLFVASITYGIFRHDLLGVSIVVKKSLIYSLLLFIVTMIYFLTVFIIGSVVGKIARIDSFPIILIVLTVITLLFRPIERRVQKMIDRLFDRRPIEELSAENFLMRSQLQDRDRMKAVATLAAGMAHEIKNPLTTIKTFAEYLPKKYDDLEFRNKFSRLVSQEVDRVNHIVKQLLEFSKPSKLDLKPVLLSDLMNESVDLLTNTLLKDKIELSKNLDQYAMILADKNQLKQALLNIFLNSIQSMKDGGSISVIVRKETDEFVKISISDTGCGIPRNQLEHIFDPFYTTKEDGTGLGLAIVHTIIRYHGGKIKVDSRVGSGTTVSVFLKSQN